MSAGREHERFTPEAVRAMAQTEPGTWSQLCADFEVWLLSLLQEGGLEELRRGVGRLNSLGFLFLEELATADRLTFGAPLEGTDSTIRLTGWSTPAGLFADVSILGPAAPPPPPDPRHERFYAHYESMSGLADDRVPGLDPFRRAVFLIGLLEAELNNGGIGQYLTNTEGVHLGATLETLERIETPVTRRVVQEASRLLNAEGLAAEEAWDVLTGPLAELDEAFFRSGEDLSGAVMDAFDDAPESERLPEGPSR